MDVIGALSYLGDYGRYQAFVFLLCALPCILGGMFMLTNVFIMFETPHRCYVADCEGSPLNDSWVQYGIPTLPNGQLSSCEQFAIDDKSFENVSVCTANVFKQNVLKCDRWVFDQRIFTTTAISEWNLVCDQAWLVPLSQSIFMVGVLCGAVICGTLADKYGRKKIFYVAPIVAIISCAMCSFAPTVWSYAILSAITSVCTAGMYLTAYVIASEAVGSSLRTWCGNLQQILFTVGEILLGIFAYFIRDWRQLEFTIMFPMLLLLILPWTLPESILWLNANGKRREACYVLKKAARWNNVKLPLEVFVKRDSQTSASFDGKPKEAKVSVLTIFRNSTLRRWSLNLYFNWMVNSLVYYSLSLQSGSISDDPFFSYFLLAVVEIPSILLGTVAMQRFGRKKVLCSFLIVGGLACLAPAVVPEDSLWVTTYLATFGKGTISATFALVYVYSVEIYPTVLRSSGLGICSMMSRLGAIGAPYVNYLQFAGRFVPLYTCGGLSIIAGLLALDLPETNNRELPQTIEDVEALKRCNSLNVDDDERQSLLNESGTS